MPVTLFPPQFHFHCGRTMKTVNVFCWAFSLRSGAIVASAMTALGVVVAAVGGVFFIVVWYDLWEEYGKPPKYEMSSSLRNKQKALHSSSAICISLSVLGLISLIFLIMGIEKNKARFIIPWMVCMLFDLILQLITITSLLAMGWWLILASLPMFGFLVYLWVVVYSFYNELQSAETNKWQRSYIPCRSSSSSNTSCPGYKFQVTSPPLMEK